MTFSIFLASQSEYIIRRCTGDVVLSNYAGSVYLLVLPGISSERSGSSEPAGGAPFLPNMVRVAATPPASDVGSFSPGLAERGGPFSHE